MTQAVLVPALRGRAFWLEEMDIGLLKTQAMVSAIKDVSKGTQQ